MTRDADDRGVADRTGRDENVLAFLKVLDPKDNTTGGGTAAAIAGAMAAALVGMVARLSVGKKDLETADYYHAIDKEAQALSRELFAGGRRDSRAFEAVQASIKLPQATVEQKQVRRAAIQGAMVQAAQVPLANAEVCRRVIDLCTRLKARSNPNAASDLECARYLARAGLLGCLANVEINLPLIGDERRVEAITKGVRGLRQFVEADNRDRQI
jgi:formiminotetrahydrofolate cyclodeaminase